MLIHNELLVCRPVLNANFFAFQLINIGVFALLTHKQGRVVIVRRGKQHLLFTLRSDIHARHHCFYATEFQAWDQAVKRLVRESAGCINLFTQCLRQVDIKTNDLVVCINRFKRRIGGFGGKTNGFGCCGGKTKTCN